MLKETQFHTQDRTKTRDGIRKEENWQVEVTDVETRPCKYSTGCIVCVLFKCAAREESRRVADEARRVLEAESNAMEREAKADAKWEETAAVRRATKQVRHFQARRNTVVIMHG